MGIISTMLTLHDLKSLDWEPLPQNGPEWVAVIRDSKEAWEKMLGRSLTPQEVFDLEFDKDAKAEIEAQN
jgi:hypothetical protein